MNINEMTLEELETRSAAILTECEQDGADLEALREEARQIGEELELRRAEAERVEARNAVAAGAGEVITTVITENGRRNTMEINSVEYRDAWLRDLRGEELDAETRSAFEEVRSAYVHTTSNTSAVIPSEILNNIWNLVNGRHALLGDVKRLMSGCSIEVVKHTAITQGAAAAVNEGAANDDETNTITSVVLSGQDFSKHVDISYATMKMALPAFQTYIEEEIAAGLSDIAATTLVTRIGTDMADGNKIATAAGTAISYANILTAFGSLKRAKNVVIYGTRKSLFVNLMGVVDGSGRPVFNPETMTAFGCPCKVEDAVADGTLLIGDPSLVLFNVIEDVLIEQAKDIKKHVVTVSGYLRAEGCLVDSVGFAKVTATPST